jgi:anti-sigma factor RsiW
MTCDEVVELVTAYLDGSLDPTTERRFMEHLARCAGCDRHLNQIRTTIAELGHLPARSLGADARDQLLAAFRSWNTG